MSLRIGGLILGKCRVSADNQCSLNRAAYAICISSVIVSNTDEGRNLFIEMLFLAPMADF
jgi:hypothetical protein